jgi:DNA-directed RNA polymerase subunit N (RpoN/RPB10)
MQGGDWGLAAPQKNEFHFNNIMSLYLPMIECSSCGNQLGHLFVPYLNMSKQLLRDTVSADRDYDSIIDALTDNKSKYEYDDGDASAFLITYYTWAKDHRDQDVFQPSNLVARALLEIKTLDNARLPFGRPGSDGQRNAYDARTCCLREFQCTPLSDATF